MMLPEIVYRQVQQGADDAVEVSFMVPCLNEEENVVGTIETIMSALTRVGCSYEILGIRRRVAGQYRRCRHGLSGCTPASACPSLP